MARAIKPRPKLEFGFKEFFAVWAQVQGWKVPKLHLEIIEFLDNCDNWSNNTAVLQVFRGAAKSTILGCFITYKLVKDPTLRFLILSADANTSVKITNDLTSIVANHPLATHLRGREKQWRESKMWVQGSTDARTPSAYSVGINSNITGSRADFVIFDDVEVLKNVGSEQLRETLRHKMSETIHILVPGGKRLFVGTPHNAESIYPEVIDQGASSLKIPLLRNPEGEFPFMTGVSSWPERFTDHDVEERQKKSLSKSNFLSQYQLMPYSAGDSYFDASLINVYRNEINVYAANGETVLTIGNKRMVSCSCFWDPSLGKTTSDDSVIALVFQTSKGELYIHRTLKLTGEAENQIKELVAFCKEYSVPQIIVESNGVGGTLPALVRKALAEAASKTVCVDKYTTESKAKKITEALEVPISYGLVYAHASVMETSFLSQLRDFTPAIVGSKSFKDDFLDAVASAIKNEPIRITSHRTNYESQGWNKSGDTFEYSTDGWSFESF